MLLSSPNKKYPTDKIVLKIFSYMEKSNEREDYLPWLVPCPFKNTRLGQTISQTRIH